MTEQEKREVRRYREEGLSFGDISEKTGISRNTVKSWCKRESIVPLEHNGICPECGRPILGRKRKFCCDECCRTWWKKHPEHAIHKSTAVYRITCKHCGKTFEVYGNRNRKYCCRKCYMADRFGTDEDVSY